VPQLRRGVDDVFECFSERPIISQPSAQFFFAAAQVKPGQLVVIAEIGL